MAACGIGPQVAIVDHGLGNLFSIMRACERAGMLGLITSDRREIENARAVILPGVGGFGDAMATLRRLDLVSPLKNVAASGKPLVGICLGLQLLMEESEEFGNHEGLGILKGRVIRLTPFQCGGRRFKVPQIGWNTVHGPGPTALSTGAAWRDTLLAGVPDGAFMYFSHSFIAAPEDAGVVLSTTRFGGEVEFCSSLTRGSVFGCQFHPERSGPVGLRVYENLAARLSAGPAAC